MQRHSLFDHYCGCLNQHCQWFTQPMDHLHWESAQVTVTPRPSGTAAAWPKGYTLQSDFGFGLRHDALIDCIRPHWRTLPQQLEFVLTVDMTGTVQNTHLEGGSPPLRLCLERALAHVSLEGGRASFDDAIAAATIRGHFRLWVEHSD